MKINFKNLFFSVAAAMSVFTLFSFANVTSVKKSIEKSSIACAALLPSLSIHESFTSEEGCTFTIKGVLTYSLWPLKATGFVGSITMSGDNCEGNYTFDLKADIHSTDENDIQNINWASESMNAVKLMYEPRTSTEIRTVFQNAIK